jgi:hypothetical protein
MFSLQVMFCTPPDFLMYFHFLDSIATAAVGCINFILSTSSNKSIQGLTKISEGCVVIEEE